MNRNQTLASKWNHSLPQSHMLKNFRQCPLPFYLTTQAILLQTAQHPMTKQEVRNWARPLAPTPQSPNPPSLSTTGPRRYPLSTQQAADPPSHSNEDVTQPSPARPESKCPSQPQHDPQPIPLQQLVDEATPSFATQIRRNQIPETKFATPTPTVSCSPQK